MLPAGGTTTPHCLAGRLRYICSRSALCGAEKSILCWRHAASWWAPPPPTAWLAGCGTAALLTPPEAQGMRWSQPHIFGASFSHSGVALLRLSTLTSACKAVLEGQFPGLAMSRRCCQCVQSVDAGGALQAAGAAACTLASGVSAVPSQQWHSCCMLPNGADASPGDITAVSAVSS